MKRLSLILVAVVLVSRLPFLSAGFGTDPDSWRIIEVARRLLSTGEYVVSRTPGHPLQEYITTIVVYFTSNPLVINFLSAAFAALLSLSFASLWKDVVKTNPTIPGIAAAFIPVLFIASTESIDFVWCASLSLTSLYFSRRGNGTIAGIMLGLACAARLTAILFVPAMLFYLFRRLSATEFWNNSLKSIAGLVVSAGIWYLQPWLTYGPTLFTFPSVSTPPPYIAFFQATIGVWGLLGCLGIILALGLALARRKLRNFSTDQIEERTDGLAILIAIIPQLILYVRLPLEANYLIPTAPLLLLGLGLMVPKREQLILSVFIIASPFILKLRSDGQISSIKGPILHINQQRQMMVNIAEASINAASNITKPAIVESGPFGPAIRVLVKDTLPLVQFGEYLQPREIEQFKSEGREIWYLPLYVVKTATIIGRGEVEGAQQLLLR